MSTQTTVLKNVWGSFAKCWGLFKDKKELRACLHFAQCGAKSWGSATKPCEGVTTDHG